MRDQVVANRITTLAIPREFAAWSKNQGKNFPTELPPRKARHFRHAIYPLAGNPAATSTTSPKATKTYEQRKRLC